MKNHLNPHTPFTKEECLALPAGKKKERLAALSAAAARGDYGWNFAETIWLEDPAKLARAFAENRAKTLRRVRGGR